MDMLVYEKELISQGHQILAGIDEAGRGPLAGPVCAACVIMPLDDIIEGVNDSKQLSAKKRANLYDKIIAKAVDYSIVFVDEQTIDRINILQATKQAMMQSINNLNVKPDYILIDAVDLGLKNNLPIIKGDAKSYLIACASILAKVSRDRLMEEMDSRYPQYNFKKHKGYGTKEHIMALKQYGPCKIHRKTFITHFVGE